MNNDKIIVEIYKEWLDPKKDQIEYKLAHLILEDVIFCNNGWWYKEEGVNWPKDYITLHVGCNDIFAWGCADAEDITHSEINELYEMYTKDNNLGPAAWCIKKRKQMPQSPVEEQFNKSKIWNLKELIK
jgi:hypothetical protein